MKTTWFDVLDARLGYTPDPDKWAHNTALAERWKYLVPCVQRNPTTYPPVLRMRVHELLEWLEEHKPRKAENPCYLPGLLKWVQSFPQIERTCEEGDDRHAGNRIPYITTKYQVYGRVFTVSTYPDWDNYNEDCSIYMGETLVMCAEG